MSFINESWVCKNCKETNGRYIYFCKKCEEIKPPSNDYLFRPITSPTDSLLSSVQCLFNRSQGSSPVEKEELQSDQKDSMEYQHIEVSNEPYNIIPYELDIIEDHKILGLLVFSSMWCSIDDTSINLVKKVLDNDYIISGIKLETIAPLALTNISGENLKQMFYNEDKDLSDVAILYLDILKKLLKNKFTYSNEIIYYILSESYYTFKNKRLFYTIKLITKLSLEEVHTCFADTDFDEINCFAISLVYFLYFEGDPISLMYNFSNGMYGSYYPMQTGKVLGGLIGSCYDCRTILENFSELKSESLYITLLEITDKIKLTRSTKFP